MRNSATASQPLPVAATAVRPGPPTVLTPAAARLCAGEMAANAHMGVQQKQLAVGSAVGMGVMGALCMWKGFEDKQE